MASPIYLDNNSTTPIDPRVCAVMQPVLEKYFGNPASTTYTFGWYAEELVAIAREHVARLLNTNADHIIFTGGATEANNLALKGAVWALELPGPHHCISAKTEHKAVLDPLVALSQRGAEVSLLDVDEFGSITEQTLRRALTPRTAVVSLMTANNEIGTIHDIRALAAAAKSQELLFHTDATQAAGKIPLDVNALGVDLLSLSAHKLYGPKGIGALYIKKRQPPIKLEPLLHGGGHEHGYRSGTLNVAGIVGFGEACRLALDEMSADEARIRALTETLFKKLSGEVGGITLNGHPEKRIPGNLSLSFSGVDAGRLLGALSTKVAVSAVSACQTGSNKPSHVLEALGFSKDRLRSSIRIGIGRFTTAEEVTNAADIIRRAVEKIRT